MSKFRKQELKKASNSEAFTISRLSENSPEIQKLQEILSPKALCTQASSWEAKSASAVALEIPVSEALSALAEISLLDAEIFRLNLQEVEDNQVSLTIRHAAKAAECIPKIISAQNYCDTLHSFFIWQLCRLLLEVYNWYFETGPALSDRLCQVLLDQGEEALKAATPLLYPLLICIHRYLEKLQDKKDANSSGSCRTSPRTRSQNRGSSSDPELESFRILPRGIYPFDGNTLPSSDHISLPEINLAHIQPDLERRKKLIIQSFVNVIFDSLLLEKVKTADNFFNSSSVRTSNLNHIRARFFARAGFLSTVIKFFEQEDGIFSVGDWKSILESPHRLFQVSDDLTFAADICRDRMKAFASLDIWLRKNVHQDALQAAKSLSNAVYVSLKQFASSLPSCPASPLGHRQQKRAATSTLGFPPASRPQTQRESSNPPLSAETLLFSAKPPSYEAAGLLLREALQKKNDQPAGNAMIRRILDGLRPALGPRSVQWTRNPDHYNPLRMSNEYTQLFLSKISPTFATSSFGISSILAFMSTGQGHLTADFIHQNEMAFTSMDACISFYNRALKTGLPCFDTRVWGPPCKHFGLCAADAPSPQGNYPTPEEKFSPFFTQDVQKKWHKFLGPALSKNDPAAVQWSLKPTWDNALQWIAEQGLVGFGSAGKPSLTAFQFCNNLVLLQICQTPTAQSLGSFISRHHRFGSFQALIGLGFNIDGRSSRFVEAAFSCFHHHLQTHLRDADHSEISFSPIISEQLLCKISRIDHILQRETSSNIWLEAQEDG